MDYDEEQTDEMEAIESIYVDEYAVVSSEPPRRFTIALTPNPPGGDENHVGVTLDVTYPATYPEAAPEVAIKVDKGVSSENVEVLNGIVQEQIAENEGEACIFMIAEGVKEWLIANNVKGNDGSMYAEMMARQRAAEKAAEEEAAAEEKAAEEEAEENEDPGGRQKRLFGTPVTAESFAAWRAAFEAETGTDPTAKTTEKPTGREFFESGTGASGAGGSAADGDDDDDAAAAAEAAMEDAQAIAEGGDGSDDDGDAAASGGAGGASKAVSQTAAPPAPAAGGPGVIDATLFTAGGLEDLDDLDDLDDD